jgi:hypothetical protein
MSVSAVLFKALKQIEVASLQPGISESGKKFEDFMVQRLYQSLRQQEAAVFQPRYTLHEPTFSGVAHQFDIVIRDDGLTVVECKFRGRVGIDQLFSFVGKVVDYQEKLNAVFLTTAPRVGEDILCYAIAHHITMVSPHLLPIGFMLEQVQPNSDLGNRLSRLQANMYDRGSPRAIMLEWQNAQRRFIAEGYR